MATPRKHWVYAIGTMMDEEQVLAIKFGVTSSSVGSRLKALQTGSFTRLEILGIRGFEFRKEANTYEKWLHSTFADHRLQGEWFRAVSTIEEMVRRSFADQFVPNWLDRNCSHDDECGCVVPRWRCA